MNKLMIPAGMIALTLCGSSEVEADQSVNIPSQIIARATGVTGIAHSKGLATRKPRQSGDHDAKINAVRNVRSSTSIISGFNSLEP
jgi:hypothetical protein